MAFLKLISENQNLSWVLEKNPNTGIIIKSNRQGFLFGFFPQKENKVIQNEYCIYFKDASDEISYKEHPDQSFEYLSSAKYTNARFINDSIQELLLSARENSHTYLSKGEDYDILSIHSMELNVVATQFKTIDIFKRYFTNIDIISTEVTKNNFTILFTTLEKTTLSYFLNLINLFGIFAVLNSNDFTYLHEGMIPKYLKILNKIDAPYFIRYLFKVRLLRTRKKFYMFKKDLESTSLYKSFSLTSGDTHDARIDWIKERIDLNSSIVDIGTGIDFKYLKIFAPLLEKKDLKYYAIEKDFDAKERIKAGIKNRQLENIEIFDTLDDFLLVHPYGEKVSIICTEVLEHNEIAEVERMVIEMITKTNFDQIIITVPNSSFNQYYGLEGEFRHNDHKWEYNKEAFAELMTSVSIKAVEVSKEMLLKEFFDVGDIIDDKAVSTGLIFTKK